MHIKGWFYGHYTSWGITQSPETCGRYGWSSSGGFPLINDMNINVLLSEGERKEDVHIGARNNSIHNGDTEAKHRTLVISPI